MHHTQLADNSPSRASNLMVATLLIVTALLSFAPIAILGPAIGWPASLSAPPALQLTHIAAKPQAVQFGYSIYLLYSILILPAMLLLARRSNGSHNKLSNLTQSLAVLAVAFASLSVLARSIGILRWLTVMPSLASSYALADAAERAVIERVFQAVHSYGGGIGELLGVSIFMSLSVASISVAALAHKSMPRLLTGLGLIAALLLFGLSAPTLGLALQVPVALAVTMLSVWFIALAVWMIIRR